MARSTDPDVLLLQAAADPTRLAILRRLSAAGPVCACELTASSDVSQPTGSHHLRVLREAGWINGERRGTWIWYSMSPAALERFLRIGASLSVGGAVPAGMLARDGRRLPVLETEAVQRSS